MWFRLGVLLSVVMMLGVVGCGGGPSDAEIDEMVRQEVERQVAEIVAPPGPQGPQGEPGQQGIQGESGVDTETRSYVDDALAVIRKDMVNLQVKTATDIQSLRGVPIRGVERVEIPSVLEVEELIVRSPDGGPWMRLVSGDGNTGVIEWHDPDLSGPVAYIFAGTTKGMVLLEYNFDGTWTEMCILQGTIALCR